MKTKSFATLAAILLGLGLGVSPSHAQTPKPETPAASQTAAVNDADKKAISKECSDQANQKGLYGKERRIFRSECKKNGGKS